MNLTFTKRIFILTVLLIPATWIAARAQEHISLQRAVDLALERNLAIKQAKFTELLADEDYKQAKFNMLPSLGVSSQGSYNFGRSPNLTTYQYTSQSFMYINGQAQASVTLFQGGQLHNQVLENKAILDADKSSTNKAKNDLVLNVVTTFLTILTNQDLVAASKQQIDIAQLNLDRVQKSFKAGNSTQADLSQAKSQLTTAQYNLVTNQNQLDIAFTTLKQYMNLPAEADVVVDVPDISKISVVNTVYDTKQVINTAMNVNPDILLAENQQKVYEKAVDVARGNYYPILSLYGALGTNYSSISQNVVGVTTVSEQIGVVQGTNTPVYGQFQSPVYSPSYSVTSQFSNNFNQSVGLNLQIPIFNHYMARTSVRKAKLNLEYAQLTTQTAKNTLTKTITQAVLDVQAAEKKYQSAQQTYEANKDAFDAYQKRYNVGLVNSLDYNTSLTNLNKAQNDMIEARYEVIFRAKIIDYYLGNPITL